MLNVASASKPALSGYERSSGHSQTMRFSIGSGLHRAETYKNGYHAQVQKPSTSAYLALHISISLTLFRLALCSIITMHFSSWTPLALSLLTISATAVPILEARKNGGATNAATKGGPASAKITVYSQYTCAAPNTVRQDHRKCRWM